MELSVQDWLIVIGALLIVGVLLDAFRRYRSESRNPIRMSRKPGFLKMGDGFRDDAESPNAELPSGGARTRDRSGAGEDEAESPPPRTALRVEPSIDGAHAPVAPPRRDAPRPEHTSLPATEPEPARERKGAAATPAAPEGAGAEVVVIHVLARQPAGFAGEALLQIFQAIDVRHGDMDIFHRHEEEKGQGAVQFSVANVTRPGSIDIATMSESSLPGLSFFLRLPGPTRPLEAFDCMLETARTVARNLDGEMQDESHSVFTTQTAEHCRQRIREFVHRSSRPRR